MNHDMILFYFYMVSRDYSLLHYVWQFRKCLNACMNGPHVVSIQSYFFWGGGSGEGGAVSFQDIAQMLFLCFYI